MVTKRRGVKFFQGEISLGDHEKSHGEISLGDHENSHGETKRSSRGGGVKFFYQETSLGHHEISHGEISPGYQENLLVNKFPVLTPPLNFERYCNQVGMSASTIPPSHP